VKIVILDPYFETLGGGEKVAAVMAEHLAKQHEVIMLVKDPISVETTNKYFDVDMSNVTFQCLPKPSLFVKLLTNRYLRLPGRWKSIIYDVASLKALRKIGADIFVNNLYQSNLPSPATKSIYLCMFPQKIETEGDYSSFIRRAYNSFTTKLEHHFVGSRQTAVESYTSVAANSKYTAGWVERYWHRKADVVYPVCDNMGPAESKKPIILNAGRFFADNGSSHHKRQDTIIKTFIEMGHDDWELHLAGSLATDVDSQKYMAALERLAAGHKNIYLHPNMKFDELRTLRRQAMIYWHATGYGYDGELFPENQEHFGMATVEAMSAEAIPIVYNSAGQAEIVRAGMDGFLWTTLDQLKQQTEQVMNDETTRKKLAAGAKKRAQTYDRGAFVKAIDALILEVTHE
jgi:glycosyltransferase involved in cell wall biosynthesis